MAREGQFSGGESLHHFSGGESEKHDLNCYCYYCALSTGTNEPGVRMRSSWNIHKASSPQLGLGHHFTLGGQEKHCLKYDVARKSHFGKKKKKVCVCVELERPV